MTRTGKSISVAILLCLSVIVLVAPHAVAQSNDVAVVVNQQNTISTLSLADLRKLLSGEKRTWPNGSRVKIIVQPPGFHERKTMLRLLGMSDGDYKQYWTAQVFRGEADAEPAMVPSFGMVKEAVKVFPGAIALVEAQNVKAGMDIKIIKVEGHLPGEPGYPLQ